ncbi:M14 family zinc carboxypeptidase [Herpetosiphon llansteffanensis]|uniref:M14 family zinc carboxypeptidase n=1 Tax=Herpetosiphon llansteffanensis TaxID=2094568 RepID=UPI000D7C1E8D|nr:M14 family zinc carboxypeptidase [Herpetosiphon llansteffanensis]
MDRLRHRWSLIGTILALIGVWSSLVVVSLPKRTEAQPVVEEQRVVARIQAKDRTESLALSARGLDLLEMRDKHDLFALITPSELAKLQQEGFTAQIDQEQTDLLQKPSILPVQGGFRTVEEGYALLDQWHATYPNLTGLFTYGASWDKVTAGGPAGYDLRGITITNSLIPGPKPTFFLMSAIHAREMSTAELTLRYTEYLLSRYQTDPDVHWLLDEHTIVIVPFVNPDGRKIAEQGSSFTQRKNRNTVDTPTCSGVNVGIDLNRNSSFHWGEVDSPGGNRCGQTWPGVSAASEPEVATLQQWIRGVFADRRGPADTDPAPADTSGVYISVHSYSDLVLWPYGHSAQLAPNDADLRGLGKKFASYNGYTPQKSDELYPTSGTTDDWAYGELGIASYTFEVGPESGSCSGFFPDFTCLDGQSQGNFWGRNLPAFLYAAKSARAPYLLQRGPDALNVTTQSASNGYKLLATINDVNNGNQAIAAAEAYVDTPPWRAGATAIGLNATDGSFNSVQEAVNATIPQTLSNGRHLVYFRGRDAAGNWGPVSAQWLDVAPQGLTGVVRASDNNQPIANATIVATTGTFTSTTTSASDGSYRLELPVGNYSVKVSGTGLTPANYSLTISSNSFTNQDLVLAQLAVLTTTPNALNFNVSDGSQERTLVIGNAGGTSFSANVTLAPMGYEVKSSDDVGGPSYNWNDISSTGSRITLGDDACSVVNLPRSFMYYGIPYTKLIVNSNGFISPTNAATCSASGTSTNGVVPGTATPNNVIAALWDDLDPSDLTSGVDGVFSYFDSANDRFIVEFSGVPHWATGGSFSPEDFQFVLDLTNGDITLQYQTVETQNSVSVGIEDSTGASGFQWVYNSTGRLHSNLAIQFVAYAGSASWLSWTPAAVDVAARGSANIQVTANSNGIANGTYRARLRVNAGANTVNGDQTVPVVFTIGSSTVHDVAVQAPQTAQSGVAGSTLTYTVNVTNTGTISDSFNLSLSGNNWPTNLSQTSVSLAAGASTSVQVVVTIPANAVATTTDSVTVTATSSADSSVSNSISLVSTATSAPISQYKVFMPYVVK